MKIDEIELGNAYELIKSVPDKSIDLIITDPPYDIPQTTGGEMLKEKRIKDMFDTLENGEFTDGISEEMLEHLIRVCKVPNIYIWCNKLLLPKLLDFFVMKKGFLFDLITWHKTNAMPLCGSKYLSDTEYCLYVHGSIHLNTTYETASTHYELPINITDKKLYGHPTIKPQSIIENLIVNSSRGGATNT